MFFTFCFIISICYFKCVHCFFSGVFYLIFRTAKLLSTSFDWGRSGFSQSPNCWSSCNVWGKKGEGVVVGDKGVLMEGDGMVFVRGLGGKWMSKLMRADVVVWVVWWYFRVQVWCWWKWSFQGLSVLWKVTSFGWMGGFVMVVEDFRMVVLAVKTLGGVWMWGHSSCGLWLWSWC